MGGECADLSCLKRGQREYHATKPWNGGWTLAAVLSSFRDKEVVRRPGHCGLLDGGGGSRESPLGVLIVCQE
jgi:hypothetical protein